MRWMWRYANGTDGIEKKRSRIEKSRRWSPLRKDRCCGEVSFCSIGIGNRVSGLSVGIYRLYHGDMLLRIATGYIRKGCNEATLPHSSRSSKTVEEDPLWSLWLAGTLNSASPAFSSLHSSPSSLLPSGLFLLHYIPFIGTPGIIRSEFVFSRPCAVLPVGVSSIRPATHYWTKTRGWKWK